MQSIKAGILEIADILVVNKADQPGAGRTVKSLEMMIHMGMTSDSRPLNADGGRPTTDDGRRDLHHDLDATPPPATRHSPPTSDPWPLAPAPWFPPVLQTVATTGQGVAELAATVARHGDYLRQSGAWATRERARSRDAIEHLLREQFIAQLAAVVSPAERADLITAVAERRLDPYTAADRLFAAALAALGQPAPEPSPAP